jgi:hypothetical protein
VTGHRLAVRCGDVPTLPSEHLMQMNADFDDPQSIENGPPRGAFAGSRLSGEVLPRGADWVQTRRWRVSARYKPDIAHRRRGADLRYLKRHLRYRAGITSTVAQRDASSCIGVLLQDHAAFRNRS